MKHFYNLQELPTRDIRSLLLRSREFRGSPLSDLLGGKHVALLFLSPSLRTRCSFEVGLQSMGAAVTTLEPGMFHKLETVDGVRMDGDGAEHVKDAVRVLSRYFDALGVRVFAGGIDRGEDTADTLFQTIMHHSDIPVFNMESALYHPCQALADLMTIEDVLGEFRCRKITITWASHPKPLPMAVANSIVLATSAMGMDVTLSHPDGFDLESGILEAARRATAASGGSLRFSRDRMSGAEGAEVVYAKSWGAMARYDDPEAENRMRRRHGDWIVDDALMGVTQGAYFMHCLPVRRNVVVRDSVIDGGKSVVFGQAENRLHVQKAMLERLVVGPGSALAPLG